MVWSKSFMNGQRSVMREQIFFFFNIEHINILLNLSYAFDILQGTPFAEICELTDVPEGLIVRTIVRLDETCREFKNAAAIMGNSALHKKMDSASNAIKRDIVFAASLYVTGV